MKEILLMVGRYEVGITVRMIDFYSASINRSILLASLLVTRPRH